MDIQEKQALIAEIERFKEEAMKSYVVSRWAESYTNTDPFGYVILKNENNKVWWMKTQAHQLWEMWKAAQAQAVLEQDQQVWATSNITWKDIAFRALSCKVLKSTENWVHVKNIAGVGSTTASLICKKLGVDPDGTKFELIEAQEPAND